MVRVSTIATFGLSGDGGDRYRLERSQLQLAGGCLFDLSIELMLPAELHPQEQTGPRTWSLSSGAPWYLLSNPDSTYWTSFETVHNSDYRYRHQQTWFSASGPLLTGEWRSLP